VLVAEIHCQLVEDYGEDGMSLQSIAKWLCGISRQKSQYMGL
jgi:hypothetical protein